MPRFTELPLTAQTAYAQLADAALPNEVRRGVASLHGSFSTKKLASGEYWYFSYRDLDGRVRQLYVGPDHDAVRRAISVETPPPASALPALAKAAVALGCQPALPKHLRAVRRLGDYGFFHAGGVLVGTHAFLALGNLLGVRWAEGQSTTDVDFAHAGKNISVALPADLKVDVHEALGSFERGFIPMVQLQGGAGPSYKLSGDEEFRIDFLTARGRGGDEPVRIPNLNVVLQPLRFMEFSLEGVTQAVLIDRNGGSAVVTVPAPERYAVHKLLVVGERGAAYRTKANKDVQQAAALIEWLHAHTPDALKGAWRDALGRGAGWRRRAAEGRRALALVAPELADALEALPA